MLDAMEPVAAPGCALFVGAVGSGRPLVMLHGGPGATHDYLRPQLDRFTDAGRRLVYYDQRGNGRSPLAAGVSFGTVDDHVSDLELVRQTLGQERLDLCGYSWGGLLALHYALRFPAHTGRLLLVSTAPARLFWREEMKARMRRAAERPSVAAWKATLDRSDRRHRFALAVAGYFYDPTQALALTPFLVRDRAEQAVWTSLGDYDLLPALAALAKERRSPTLLIHGSDDPIPVEAARETAAALGAPLVEIPACGHVPYVEQPAAFFPPALDFLAAD